MRRGWGGVEVDGGMRQAARAGQDKAIEGMV